MARKTMTREITTTTIRAAKMEVVDGMPQAIPVEVEPVIGAMTLEKAQKHVKKEHGEGITVFEVQKDTKKYAMAVEDFIKYAEVVEDEETEVAEDAE